METQGILANIATCGPLGRLPFGGIVASLIAVPIWYLTHGVFGSSVYSVVVITLLLLGLVLGLIEIALRKGVPPDRTAIVLDRVVGLHIALLFLPVWLKLIVFAVVCFNLVSMASRVVQFRGFLARLPHLPGSLGIVSGDVVAGLVVNLFLHLMLWIMH